MGCFFSLTLTQKNPWKSNKINLILQKRDWKFKTLGAKQIYFKNHIMFLWPSEDRSKYFSLWCLKIICFLKSSKYSAFFSFSFFCGPVNRIKNGKRFKYSYLYNLYDCAFHKTTVPSAAPDTKQVESGENRQTLTGLPLGCPITAKVCPFWVSHKAVVPSVEHEAKICPEGEKQQQWTA